MVSLDHLLHLVVLCIEEFLGFWLHVFDSFLLLALGGRYKVEEWRLLWVQGHLA